MKRERKKKSMTLRLREIEQQKTSTMVQRQSAQMLKLVSEMRDELRVELKKELIQEKQMEEEEDSYSDVSIKISLFPCVWKLGCNSRIVLLVFPVHSFFSGLLRSDFSRRFLIYLTKSVGIATSLVGRLEVFRIYLFHILNFCNIFNVCAYTVILIISPSTTGRTHNTNWLLKQNLRFLKESLILRNMHIMVLGM